MGTGVNALHYYTGRQAACQTRYAGRDRARAGSVVGDGDCKRKTMEGPRRTLASDRSDDSLRSPPPGPTAALALARRRRCLDFGFTSSPSSLALTVTRLSLTCRFDANSLSTSAQSNTPTVHSCSLVGPAGSKSDMRKRKAERGRNCLETMMKRTAAPVHIRTRAMKVQKGAG